MASVNRAIILGNLGQDPELRYMPNGGAVVTLSIATKSTWKDKNSGERREATEWHRVVLFNRLAEIAGEYLKKGRSVYIEGRLETKKWQDKEGNDRYTTQILGEQLKMIGGKSDDKPTYSHDNKQQGTQQPQQGGIADLDDDIPF